jgi:hypothetical protein
MRTEIVRELLLRRRRARVPWVYLVYHRHAPEGARESLPRDSAAAGTTAGSVLPAQKRGHVERRREIRVEREAVLFPLLS